MECPSRIALTLDELVPGADFRSRHTLRVAAPPAAVWEALQELRLSDAPLTRALICVRGAPARLAGRRRRMVSGRFMEHPPVPVLGIEPGRSVVAGAVLQPWKLTGGGAAPSLDAAQLRAFTQAGWVKAGLDFVLEPDGDGTRPITHTRVGATDARTRRRFGVYWALIRAGSGLVRRDLLRAVARRASAG